MINEKKGNRLFLKSFSFLFLLLLSIFLVSASYGYNNPSTNNNSYGYNSPNAVISSTSSSGNITNNNNYYNITQNTTNNITNNIFNNVFDQILNTTSNVSFANLNLTGNFTALNITGTYLFGNGRYLTGLNQTNASYLTTETNWNANYSNFSNLYSNFVNYMGNSTFATWVNVINGTAITFLDNSTNNQTRNINISNPLAQDYFNISNQTTSEFVVLGSSGKIGINTTTPQNALNVMGGLNISNINGLNSFVINETTGFVGINTTTLSSTSWGSTLNIFGNSSFNYTYTNTTANSSVNYTAENILASRWMAVNSFDAGNLVGLNLSVLRGTSLNDNGTMNGSSYWSGLFGEVINYGFSNMTGGLINGNTTNAYGLFIQPYLQTGNITNMYDLFIGNLTNTALVNFSGGIITNFWGIYENSTATNYIAGNTTINNNVNITGQGNITLSANSMIQLTVNTTALICGASSNGTIARNATGLIYCNGTNSWWYLGTPHG
jgi:hypothetical protein